MIGFIALACSSSPTEATDATLNLRFGQTARAGSLTVTFSDVTDDSRCPANVQCVWAGDAAIRLRVQDGGESADIVLHTHGGTNFPMTATFRDHEIRLVELAPAPREQRPEKNQYRATLRID